MRSTSESSVAVYTLRVERDKLSRLREIAEGEHRSLSQELRHMIDARIALEDEKAAA